MDKLLSIIIPTYNMEQYLRYCLDSLLIGENLNKLEVLVINDGSKDKSSEIAHEYQDKYPEVFRVVDKKNGNYGSCINKGLEIATGKYVKVLDADDSFDAQNFEDFVNYLGEIEADLILSDFVIVDETRAVTSSKEYGFDQGVCYSMNEICVSSSFQRMQMHAVTYRLSNLKEINYIQTEGVSYTDQQWIFIPMSVVKTVYCYTKPVYRYLIGREGQTMAVKSVVKYSDHMMPCLEGMIKSYSNIEQVVEYPLLSYFQSILTPLIKGLYVEFFSDNSVESMSRLNYFDARLNEWHAGVYEMIAKKGVVSMHIKAWRQARWSLPILRLTLKIYLSFLRVRS